MSFRAAGEESLKPRSEKPIALGKKPAYLAAGVFRWALRRATQLGLLLAVLLLTGCATRPDVVQQRHRRPAGEIWGEQTVGQTFVAGKDGLNRIDLFLATYARDNAGPVTFHLRESPTAVRDLATFQFDASDVKDNTYRTFAFPPLLDSQNRSYYFFLEAPAAEPGNAITVWSSPIDTYSHGEAYVAGQPNAGDLAFRTYAEYSIAQIGRDLWRGIRRHAGTGLLAVFLFAVPGAAVLSLLSWRLEIRDWRFSRSKFRSKGIVKSPVRPGFGNPGRTKLDLQRLETRSQVFNSEYWEFIILAAGLSVAIAPLLLLSAYLAGLHLERASTLSLLIVFAIVTIPPVFRSGLRTLHSVASASSHSKHPTSNLQSPISNLQSPISNLQSPAVLLLPIFLISLAARLLVVQELVAPMWGDSYHHTLIAQLLVDHGGLFQSWEPYAPLRSFTYHFGFHSNVALFHWLTGTPVLESVIVVGQILNALAPLMLYPLVRRLGGSAWAGVIAVLIASLLSPMPAGYVNWGRYTQLTGMVVLPVAATLMISAINDADRRWARLALASVALAGLALSHYLVTLLFLPLTLTCVAWETGIHAQSAGRKMTPLVRPWLRAGMIALAAAVLIAPWIQNVWRGRLPRVLAGRLIGNPGSTYFQTAYNVVGDVLAFVPLWLLALAAAGLLWGCWKRQRLVIIVGIWTGLLILVANPNILGLPGAGLVNNFTLLIALYLPLSMLAGAGLGTLIERVTDIEVSIQHSISQLVAATLVIVAALAGARLRLMDLDYQYLLVTPADREAMQWIRDHTSEDARFLVNALTAFGGHTVVGDDAGWWIPYLASRRTTVPPAIYGTELPLDPDYAAQTRAFHREIIAQPLDIPTASQLLRAHNITHIYIGAVGDEFLDPASLTGSPFYRLVYSRDGAMIFEVAEE